MPTQQKSQHYLFIMLGFPGSGKSYVSEWLSPLFQAVHLRTDDLRLAMFGKDRKELHDAALKTQVNRALQYATQQILAQNHSVVFDANNNRRKTRTYLGMVAKRYNATAIVVWVQAPLELVKERVVSREEAGGHKIFNPHFVDKMASRLEKPSYGETVVIIDGTQTTVKQQASFGDQLKSLHDGVK